MATVLLAWELGEGFGHVHALVQVGRALAEEGHRPVLALRNLVEPGPMYRACPFPVFQAPCLQRILWDHDRPFQAANFADVLGVHGWASGDALACLIHAWQSLIEAVGADLIVCDFAPTACLTAYGTLPVLQLGHWFGMPPVAGTTFPEMLPGRPPACDQDQILAVVQDVQRRRARPIPESLPAILRETNRFPTVLPELDCYAEFRQEPTWDPLEPLPPPASAATRDFFAYLGAEFMQAEAILSQLAATGHRGTVYLRSSTGPQRQRLQQKGLQVLDEPACVPQMLEEHAVVVHHGGGLTQSALAAGRPQVLLPRHLEQGLTAQRLYRLGAGVYLVGDVPPEAAAGALLDVLTDGRFSHAALTHARAIHARQRRPGLAAILERCLTILESSG